MCLINFQFHSHPQYKLILAANRDEFHQRPTAPAQFWKDHPHILAGRDLLGMGTWLGITKTGRFAALTNCRNANDNQTYPESRGTIVKDFLNDTMSASEFLLCLQETKDRYAGFNIIAGTPDHLVYYNNIENNIATVSQGTHGLSNAFLDTPWPKVSKGTSRLAAYTGQHRHVATEPLFNILSDTEKAADNDLPESEITHVDRQLSPIFIKTSGYGTRSSTVLLIDRNNHAVFAERTYQNGAFKIEKPFSFTIG
ncbi:NRDE family protein [Barrientosiimonas marina]|uniref:NRDE family protein n=1 Tax=Lentibacillus kimchii TaxID=1542911 RepID=A0ABW2USN9_9BACI